MERARGRRGNRRTKAGGHKELRDTSNPEIPLRDISSDREIASAQYRALQESERCNGFLSVAKYK